MTWSYVTILFIIVWILGFTIFIFEFFNTSYSRFENITSNWKCSWLYICTHALYNFFAFRATKPWNSLPQSSCIVNATLTYSCSNSGLPPLIYQWSTGIWENPRTCPIQRILGACGNFWTSEKFLGFSEIVLQRYINYGFRLSWLTWLFSRAF